MARGGVPRANQHEVNNNTLKPEPSTTLSWNPAQICFRTSGWCPCTSPPKIDAEPEVGDTGCDNPHKGGLAGTAYSGQSENLLPVDVQVQAIEDPDRS